ncbi:MAG: hypothetical protein WCK31_00690, partial [bacterium]
MTFSNPFLKLKRFASKRSSVARIKSDKEIVHTKSKLVTKIIRVAVLVLVVILIIFLIYSSIPNVIAINRFEPKTYSQTEASNKLMRSNILLIIID